METLLMECNVGERIKDQYGKTKEENAAMGNNGKETRERKCDKWNSKGSNGGYRKQGNIKRKYNK